MYYFENSQQRSLLVMTDYLIVLNCVELTKRMIIYEVLRNRFSFNSLYSIGVLNQ